MIRRTIIISYDKNIKKIIIIPSFYSDVINTLLKGSQVQTYLPPFVALTVFGYERRTSSFRRGDSARKWKFEMPVMKKVVYGN